MNRFVQVALGVVIGSLFGVGHIYAAEAQTPWYMELRPHYEEETMQMEIPDLPWETRHLLAALVMAEAGNQDIYGKRLVVDTVLNRVADPEFPDTIPDVIYQKYQFSVVGSGELQKYLDGASGHEIFAECYTIIEEELIDQVDYDVIFFCSGGWPQYGERAYKYGDHYFAKR